MNIRDYLMIKKYKKIRRKAYKIVSQMEKVGHIVTSISIDMYEGKISIGSFLYGKKIPVRIIRI
jgi:hypothetical protein